MYIYTSNTYNQLVGIKSITTNGVIIRKRCGGEQLKNRKKQNEIDGERKTEGERQTGQTDRQTNEYFEKNEFQKKNIFKPVKSN